MGGGDQHERSATSKAQSRVRHVFGGAWTEIKLGAIEYYLNFYTRALADQPSIDRPFVLTYVDAFAGSGSRTAEAVTGGLLENIPIGYDEVELAGSAARALNVQPGFSRYTFIEGNSSRLRGLAQLSALHPDKKIAIEHGETNAVLSRIFSNQPWCSPGLNRAVVFLDPYGMNVEWSTLQILADTRSCDVWYLFPLEGVTRQLAATIDKVDNYKQGALDRIFGTPSWRTDLYTTQVQYSLLEGLETSGSRKVSTKQVEAYARSRLGTLFAFVSDPVPLLAEGRGQLFSLLCLANSRSERATALIRRGVSSVLKKYA